MKKESNAKTYFEWILMIVLILGVFYISKKYGLIENLRPETSIQKYVSIVGIILMGFIVLGVHELGHLIAGLINKFQFELFVVGPLGIKRADNRIKFYLNKNVGYYGGIAATSPTDNSPDNAKKFAQVLLAGPIASILFALFCFVISNFLGKPLGFILYTGGMISIAIFFATTIPSKSGVFFTDRKRYQRLVTPGKDQDVELAMLKIMGTFSKDNSYKNVDEKDIQIMVSDDLPFMKYMGLFNLICYQLETKGAVDEEVTQEYENLSTSMSKNLVASFNQEIEKYKIKIELESIHK